MSPYVRTVKTASGATAVQVVWSNKRGKKDMDHIGSAHTPEDLEVLKTIARQRMTVRSGRARSRRRETAWTGVDDPSVTLGTPVGSVVGRLPGRGS